MEIQQNNMMSHIMQAERHGCSSLKEGEFTDEKNYCSLNTDGGSLAHQLESFPSMLTWLKCTAVDPCYPIASVRTNQESCNQILKVRMALSLSTTELPWRKRKLNQIIEETVAGTHELATKKSNEKSSPKRAKGSSTSVRPCSIGSSMSEESSDQLFKTAGGSVRPLRFGDNLSRKRVPFVLHFQAEAEECSSSPDEGLPVSVDSDDSFSGSNLPSSQNTDTHISTNPPKLKNPLLLHHKSEISHSSNFTGEYLPRRIAVPYGPGFQADIPEWTANGSRDASERWLGTRIWSVDSGTAETNRKLIGKGRPSSCKCVEPSSRMCIQYHILEEKLRLRSELGSAFVSWKFDEMGENVSKSWTLGEQISFDNLVKTNPVSQDKSFWKPALECFPFKSRESIASYYFNVYVLRRIGKQTRLNPAGVDTDDDEAN